MSLAVVACMCGSSESLARNFLKSVGCPDWLTIPIYRGKDKSKSMLNQFPPVAEREMLEHFLQDASKWVVIVGYDQNSMRWSDIAHNAPKSRIEAEFVVKAYS